MPGVEPMPPVLDPEPVLDPVPPVLDPELMPPVLEPLEAPPVPSEPVLPEVLPEALPAPVVLEPSSCRHCSFCVPVSESQRDGPVEEGEALLLEPTEGEVVLLDSEGEVVLLDPAEGEVVLLEPAAGELVLLLPTPLAPVLLLAPPELWANAPDMAKSAAAVAETTSFRFICAPLGGWNEMELQLRGTQGPCRQRVVS